MNADIRTLAVVIAVIYFLQAIALTLQYMVNKTYCGIGWWASGCIATATGFVLLLFRDFISVENISIMSANIMLLSGQIFFYIGTSRFLDKKENRLIIILIFLIFITSTFYVVYINKNDSLRPLILYASAAVFLFLTACRLLTAGIHSIKSSANFVSATFFLHGIFLIIRIVFALTVSEITGVFIPELIQVAAFMVPLISSTLCTFGFIIMVSQRLNAESIDDKDKFELIFEASPDAAIINQLDDGVVININGGFTLLTGYSREDIIGKSGRDLNLWVNSGDRLKALDELTVKGFFKNYETVLRMRDGRIIDVIMSAKIITLKNVEHILMVIHDVTERKKTEDKIRSLLEEKELILKEIHHRIKNNMNTVNSLLMLQAEALTEPAAVSALKDAGSRVQSMMILYDKLYKSDDFQIMPVINYLSPLVDEVVMNFPKSRIIRIEKTIDDFNLDVKTLQSIGIIFNELLTNIMKYAFEDRNDGVISVSALLTGNTASFIIADNGRGLPESVNFENSTGFGLMLIDILSKQLGGVMRIERNSGTKFVLEFEL
jgi:PAS domain S-box-containing protein